VLLEVWGVACDVSFLVCLCPADKITVISGAIIFRMAEEGLPRFILELDNTLLRADPPMRFAGFGQAASL